MILVNEKVEHINLGVGVITEEKDNKIWVRFHEDVGNKIFLYPDSFEKFLKAVNPAVEDNVLKELHRKQEQLELLEREREAAEMEERRIKLASATRKSGRVAKKKA